jgi:uncharacterized protein (TIGR02145 family)
MDDFVNLNTALSGTAANYPSAWGGVFGGYAVDDKIVSTGSYASYWSSTAVNASSGYNLTFNTSVYVNTQTETQKRYGLFVRCVK